MKKPPRHEPHAITDANAARADTGYLILVVDDLPDARYYKKVLLELEGFRIVEAENGREGVDAALRERPRLILMNYLMPELNGLEASRIIHEHADLKDIPIIMNSACSIDEMKERALKAGCVDYIEEPTDFDDLMEMVMRHILVG